MYPVKKSVTFNHINYNWSLFLLHKGNLTYHGKYLREEFDKIL